jgi:hypothetical protein
MEFKAYIFETEAQAKQAVQSINAYFGIPVSPDAVTQTYTQYEHHQGLWYIRHLDELEAILGEPVLLEITENDIENM